MKLTDAAKKGRTDAVVAALDDKESTNLQILLRKVYQDFHTIKKSDDHFELARVLLSRGAKPEREMVCEAARGGHHALIELLQEEGLSADIFLAAATGNVELAKHLIAERPDCVADCDSSGMTALHYCCSSVIWKNSDELEIAFGETCSRLLDAGSDIHAEGEYYGLTGVTPLFYCAWTGGHPGIAEQILHCGSEVTPRIFLAAMGHFQRHGDGNYAIAEKLIKHGFDVNHNDGRTALHAFASHEDVRGVTWLIERGADHTARDAEGNTPLIVAAGRNSGIKVLKVLIDAGCPVSGINDLGLSALDVARSAGKAKSIAFLEANNT